MHLNNHHICSGVILSKSTVLTARSCVDHRKLVEYTTSVGSTYSNGAAGGVFRSITSVTRPHYPAVLDLIILTLNESLSFDNTVKAVIHPRADYVVDYNSLATVTGWNEQDKHTIGHLREVSLQVITNDECQKLYGVRRMILNDLHICTARKGLVEIEVGSPLVDKSGVLIGIVRGDHVGNRTQDPFVFEYAPYSAAWF